MSGPYPGSCLCGAIAFEADRFTDSTGNCHCSMCHIFRGAPEATIAGVERQHFRGLRGEEVLNAWTADNDTTRSFCRHCGSSLMFSSPRAPHNIVELALGAFDGEVPVRASAHIVTGLAANGVSIPAGEPQFEAGRNSARLR